LPASAQATFTDDTDRQAGASGKLIDPVVTVLSVYDPSGLAIQVPVTCKDPLTGTDGHPRLANMTSMSPDSARHDDVTFQVPTTEPPHAVTPGQLGTDPPLPVVAPVGVAPPEPVVPPVPPDWPVELLQPPPAMAAARTTKQINPVLIRIGLSSSNCQKPAAFVHRSSLFL